jgi:hypothetical protein
MKAPTAKPSLRCAIYTRVSTDARLEQEFNSLDAQREASEAYIPLPRARSAISYRRLLGPNLGT